MTQRQKRTISDALLAGRRYVGDPGAVPKRIIRAALLLLLAVPATAADPTVDQLVQAYAGAPWVLVPTEDGQKFYCIDELNSRRVDWIVTKIAEHAKGASCS